MDSFTSAWSVVTTAYTVIDFFANVASAGEDCRQLVRELYNTTRMIDNIRILAEENAGQLKYLDALLVPNGGLDQFRHTVDELSMRILKSKGIKEALMRVKFVLRRQTMQELLQSIQRQQTPFITCLGVENTKLLLQLTAEVSALSYGMQHFTAQASSDESPSQGSLIEHAFLVPYSQDTHSLVVRDAYHNIIESKFEDCTRLTLYGLGGSGKSRLAIEFAYRHKAASPVFWVYAGSDATFQSSYGKIAQEIPPEFRRRFDEDLNGQKRNLTSSKVKLVTTWLESHESGDWIIVLDNIDNQNMLQGQDNEPSILKKLPVRSKGKILATCRRKDIALAISGSENAVVHVGAFPPKEAVKCFKLLLPNDKATDSEILSLAQELGFLPLAIRQAAAYISNKSASIEEYSRHLASNETARLGLLEQDFPDATRADDVPNSVVRTWLVSFEQISHQNKEAAKMLCYMAIIDSSRIQAHILKEVWKDPLAFRANIGLLLAYSFVEVVGSHRNAYTMHRLLQLSTRMWMTRRGEKETFSRMALSNILKLFEDAVTTFSWRDCHTLLPHARSILSNNFDSPEVTVKKATLMALVESFENPPLWQLISRHNSERYRQLSSNMKGLIDILPTLESYSCFQDWLRGSQSLLLLKGGPGSGKSVACTFVIQNLQSRLDSSGSRPIVAYFFLSVGINKSADIVKALHFDILSQICQQVSSARVPERVRTLLSTPDELRSRNHLLETITDLCRDTDERTYVILDGLDLCGEESMIEILKSVAYLMGKRINLSIMMSSRWDTRIDDLISKSRGAVISLEQSNLALDKYVSTILRPFHLTAERKAIIHQQLIDVSSGSFLFLLTMKGRIKNANDLDQMVQQLQKPLPDANQTLKKAFQSYWRLLLDVGPEHQKQVSVLLRCAAFAFRPLEKRELENIMNLQGQECLPPPVMRFARMMEDGILVTQDFMTKNAPSLASMAQASIREFLSTTGAGDFQVLHTAEAHRTILDVCLKLLVERGGSRSVDLKQHPFLQYAAEFWPKHLEEARKSNTHSTSINDNTSDYLRTLFDNAAPAAFLCWLRLADPAEPGRGAQPEKNLEDFRPMEFYLDMLDLQSFMMGSRRNSITSRMAMTYLAAAAILAIAFYIAHTKKVLKGGWD